LADGHGRRHGAEAPFAGRLWEWKLASPGDVSRLKGGCSQDWLPH
jgi:hypothetical protein